MDIIYIYIDRYYIPFYPLLIPAMDGDAHILMLHSPMNRGISTFFIGGPEKKNSRMDFTIGLNQMRFEGI